MHDQAVVFAAIAAGGFTAFGDRSAIVDSARPIG